MRNVIVLSLLLTGCGAPTDNFTYTDLRTRDYTIIDPVFMPFLATFQNYYDVVLKNTHVIFASTNEIIANSSGICSMATNQKSLIMINKDYWDLSNVFGREQLLFHELGHCILNLGHDAGKLDITVDSQTQAIPNSIMYPSSFGNNRYYPYIRQYYLEQLNKMRGN